MPILHTAITHYYILTWDIPKAPIFIAPWFNSNTIITCIKITIFNQYIITRLRIAAIIIITMTLHLHLPYCYIFWQQRMDQPKWSTINRKSFQKNIFALIEIDKLRSYATLSTKHTFVKRNRILFHFIKQCLFVCMLTIFLHHTSNSLITEPIWSISLPIHYTITGNCNIYFLIGIY